MTAPSNRRPRVAVVWRGDVQARAAVSAESSRLTAIFAALEAEGLAPEPAVYGEDCEAEFRAQLLDVDAALVWVDPVSNGLRRQGLDAILREACLAGVLVSGHPDVIDRIGVKSVLHTTRSLGWGSDTHLYATPETFEAEFPARLSTGPRVLKPNRGNGGIGVCRVEAGEGGNVHVREARGEPAERTLPLARFIAERSDELVSSGGLVDQPFQPRLTDGMVRCYLSGGRVAGFGHQMVRALAAPEDGPAGPRLYSGPDDPRFQKLRWKMEEAWAPGMAALLDIPVRDLPVIWDADFLLGPKDATGEDTFVLCEINASSVFPVPDEAPAMLAHTLAERLAARRSPVSPKEYRDA